MFELGLSTCGNKLNGGAAFFGECRAAGVRCLEITPSSAYVPDFDWKGTKKLADEYGIRLWSFHLPFAPFECFDISSEREELRRASLDVCRILMDRAAECGIPHVIIHPSGEPIAPERRGARMAAAKESLKTLAQEAADRNVTVCAEDLPRTCLGRDSAEILELIGVDERLRVCFDTNHLLTEDPADFVRRVGKKIVTLHVSDYDGIDEKHWLCGEGITDWPALTAALRETGYAGPWLYEVGFDAPASMPRSRRLTCADFARNAREAQGGGPVTRVR